MKFLESKPIYLKPFLKSDVTSRYISWLNDPEVNQYSVRRVHPYTDIEAYKYIENLNHNEKVLAICSNDTDEHIGNIKYGPIDWSNLNCEISIVIGEKSYWNKGIASEAIYLILKHLFFTLDMNRVGADSCNPAFIKMAKKLGFRAEGVMKNRMRFGNRFVDYTVLGILKSEFKVIKQYEK